MIRAKSPIAAGPSLQKIPGSDAGLLGSCAMKSVSRFVIYQHGRVLVFHLAGCGRAGKAQPWAWVEPLTNSQIRRWIEPLGIRPCVRCDPLEDKYMEDK